MNSLVFIELAKRWESDAKEETRVQEDSDAGRVAEARREGYLEAKRECADGIRMLVSLLGNLKNTN